MSAGEKEKMRVRKRERYSSLTWLSRPKKTIMMKKKQAQRGEKGIIDTARGYAMKARPGPGIQRVITGKGGVLTGHNRSLHNCHPASRTLDPYCNNDLYPTVF